MDEENSTLSKVEQEMQDACAELNAYAIRIRDNTEDDLIAQQRVLSSLDACDSATSKLEELLRTGAY